MPNIKCGNCKKIAYKKHSKAKFCSRLCANTKNNYGQYLKPRALKYSDEELLSNLKNLAAKLGRTPSRNDVRCPDSKTYQIRFGSYNNAIIAAGLMPNIQYPPSYFEQERNIVPVKLRFEILKRDLFKCKYCGGIPEEGYILHVDHVVPKSKGGLTEISNLVTSCNICNMGKSNS